MCRTVRTLCSVIGRYTYQVTKLYHVLVDHHRIDLPFQQNQERPPSMRVSKLPICQNSPSSPEPATRRKTEPSPGPAEPSWPNPSHRNDPSGYINTALYPMQAMTSSPADVRSVSTASLPPSEPTNPPNTGPRPVPGITFSPNVLHPTCPINPANTRSPVQARTSAPSEVSSVSPASPLYLK